MAKINRPTVKDEIKSAVMKLMTRKNYMDISVTDIITEAEVARASFYRNFGSINDVIDAISDEIADELIAEVFPILNSNDERQWREFLFYHFYRFTKIQKEIGDMRIENMSVLFTHIEDRIEQKELHSQADALRDKYLAVGKMGLINGITKKWINSGTKETPEEMINYIMSFITTI